MAGTLPPRLLVKICGIRTVDAALAAAAAGADLLGFNFAPVSKRRVDAALAAEAAQAVRGGRGAVPAVAGIFVNQAVVDVQQTARRVRLEYVQLSGDEDAEYCRAVSAATGLPVIKAVRLSGQDDEHAARYAADVALLLADAAVAGSWGGSGQAWDWRSAAGLASRVPLLLAGGLNLENVAAAIDAVRPRGVDVASGVESGGLTDAGKVQAFIQRVRDHERSHRSAGQQSIAGNRN